MSNQTQAMSCAKKAAGYKKETTCKYYSYSAKRIVSGMTANSVSTKSERMF